eukprot:858901-Amphidinium_carterae.2
MPKVATTTTTDRMETKLGKQINLTTDACLKSNMVGRYEEMFSYTNHVQMKQSLWHRPPHLSTFKFFAENAFGDACFNACKIIQYLLLMSSAAKYKAQKERIGKPLNSRAIQI